MKKTQLKFLSNNNFFIDEAYKVLRTNIQFCGKDIKTIAITSCFENEGKTTTVLSLARSFSELDKKVLVIDTDMRKSVMASRNSDAVNVKGLSELLTGLESKEDCIYNTQYKGLDIIFAGRICPNPVELLNESEFGKLISWARDNYDYVLVDTPPLGVVIDAAVVGPLVDGVAIIISEHVKCSVAKKVVGQLSKGGSKILGVIRKKIGKVQPEKKENSLNFK